MTDEGPLRKGNENRFRWWSADGGLTTPAWIAVGLAIAVVVLGFGAWWTYGLNRGMPSGVDGAIGASTASPSMGGMDGPMFPPVHGFFDGAEILFFHTEASDAQVADMLTGMMGSPVLLVPSLADVPDSALATVYVFTNGVQPDGPRGPFGFQPDVFDSAPGDADYTPLRSINLVTWSDPTRASLLRSAEEIEAAIDEGRLTVERPGVVVNMPFLAWPGGER